MRNLIERLLRFQQRKVEAKDFVLILKYKDIPIGHLWFKDKLYYFEYDSAFGNTNLNKLPDFPDTAKKYQSPVLFPFFEMRIPSLNREDVGEWMKENKITLDASDLELLSTFGRNSSSDPYVLEIDKSR